MTLDKQIEAVLFHNAEPIALKRLAEVLENDEKQIEEALVILEEKLINRGICIVRHGGKIMLGTSPESSHLISRITKEEREGELGKAGLETLSIILYKGPISKKEIDYIRGVNSSYILRNLLIKGLVEKAEIKSGRNTYYQGTLELLSFMGIEGVEALPEYENTKKEMEKLKLKQEE